MSAPRAARTATTPRTGRVPKSRPSASVRRVGYVFAVLFDAAFLWLLYIAPGWEAVPFLTPDFADVLWLVGLPLWVGVGANLLYLVRDPRWLTALGGLLSTVVGLIAAIQLWQVFPFDLSDAWTVVFRIALVVGIVGSAIAILVSAVTFVRALAAGDEQRFG